MSNSPAFLFDVTLIQLAPDAKRADIEYGTVSRPGISEKELRTLLNAADALAPTVSYPLSPEIRLTGPTGRYVVQIKEGRLQFVSWASAKSRGGNPTVDQIMGIVTGAATEGDAAYQAPEAAGEKASGGGSRGLFIALMAIVIVGVNGFTFWNAKRPPGNFLPQYRMLAPEPGERFLTSVAGYYETGRDPGDRRLQIARDGRVVWIKFGLARSVKQQSSFTVQSVEAEGASALLTSTSGMIKVKDPSTVTYFGDTYVRVLN